MVNWLRFAESIIRAAKGEKGIVEPTFIYLPGIEGGDAIAKETGVDFFSVPVELGVSNTSTLQHPMFSRVLQR
jgi:malate dehydrogenase